MINYEKVQKMNINELAGFLGKSFSCAFCPISDENCLKSGSCRNAILEWLNQECRSKDDSHSDVTIEGEKYEMGKP